MSAPIIFCSARSTIGIDKLYLKRKGVLALTSSRIESELNQLFGASMIRFRLKELIAEKEFQEGRRVTLEEVSRETGVHRTTLSKIANQKGYTTNTDVLDKLCTFFGVEISSIAEHISDEGLDKGQSGSDNRVG